MGKIIPLRSNLYVNQLKETKEHLEEIAEQLFEDAINIASKGKWQQWFANAKEGDVKHFSEDMLWTTDDKNIHAVLNMRETVLETLKKIK